MSKSKQIAAGGIASSLCLLLMFLTGVFPFATYAPVSYTHLDVYKRQRRNLAPMLSRAQVSEATT